MFKFFRRYFTLICVALSFYLPGCAQVKEGGLQVTLENILTLSVDTLSAPILNAELEDGQNLVLLDARAEKEFAVSHLANARYVGYYAFKKKNIADIPKDANIVVYCTVGYRSEKIAERIEKMGYKNVRNLYGGICTWVNSGFEIVDQDGAVTQKVHTYDKAWSMFFERGDKVND